MTGSLETELKFLITPEQLKQLLRKDLHRSKKQYQKTVMYDNKQGLMQKTNGRVRLRLTGKKVSLSYKRPLPNKRVKQEIELETRIDSWEIGENILFEMGFSPTTSYEKYRTSFVYQGVRVDIDEYPFASFVEFEGSESKIKLVAKEFGFDMNRNLTKACDTLFTEWRQNHGLPMTPHMRFSDYDK